jgi:hypothetical protein
MIRPIIYRVIPRLIIGLIIALAWDRFLNVQKLLSMVDHAFFVLGILFFAMAWVSYLKLDGIKFHYLNEKKEKTPKHPIKQPIDYIEEEPSPDDHLADNEKSFATLISNIIAGLCFLLPSLFSLLPNP